MGVKHLTCSYEARVSPVPQYGVLGLAPGQGQSGYGSKISTDYMIKFNGRWHRVYCICWSNSGSLYVRSRGENLYLDEYHLREKVK